MTVLWIFLTLVILIGLYVVLTYNRFVKLKVNVEEAWSDIEVQMKRRYNLIPNLISTVKGYAKHERGAFEAVTKARTAAMKSTGGAESQGKAEGMFTSALKTLFAVAEAYPELKADKSFQKLQAELSALEDYIQKARRFYNGNVRLINTLVNQFPSNLVARAFAFITAEFFELAEAEAAAAKQPPKVEF
ncbi:MAG: LemA family protein [Proteobacteria bacterium]|nr:LemA family protein [Pseudomonadota bacterium]